MKINKKKTPQWQKQELQNINVRVKHIFDYIDAFDSALTNNTQVKDQFQKKFDELKNEINGNFESSLKKWTKENNDLHNQNRNLINKNREQENEISNLLQKLNDITNLNNDNNKLKELALKEKQESANDFRGKLDVLLMDNDMLKKTK